MAVLLMPKKILLKVLTNKERCRIFDLSNNSSLLKLETMTAQQILGRFNFAIEQNQQGEMPAQETETVVRHLYGCVQEVSDSIPEESYDQKRAAHSVRFEMNETLRSLGIEVEY